MIIYLQSEFRQQFWVSKYSSIHFILSQHRYFQIVWHYNRINLINQHSVYTMANVTGLCIVLKSNVFTELIFTIRLFLKRLYYRIKILIRNSLERWQKSEYPLFKTVASQKDLLLNLDGCNQSTEIYSTYRFCSNSKKCSPFECVSFSNIVN